MAEAIFKHLAPEIIVQSAGAYSSHVRPGVKRVLSEIGVDAYGLRSKDLFGVEFDEVDVVIFLCRESEAPRVSGHLRQLRWELPDPLCAPESEKIEAFRALRDELMRRIAVLLSTIPED